MCNLSQEGSGNTAAQNLCRWFGMHANKLKLQTILRAVSVVTCPLLVKPFVWTTMFITIPGLKFELNEQRNGYPGT